MSRWSHEDVPVMSGRARKFRFHEHGQPLSFGRAVDLLGADADFRNHLSTLIAASPSRALRWETPALSLALQGRPFECVLVDAPYLDLSPEPQVFAAHFDGLPAEVLATAVPNLSRTAHLVVPRGGLAADAVYAHLAAFLRGAPPAQVHALWIGVAQTVQAVLSDRPLWLSTAGGGVNWLHVRIEHSPKYYRYRPYADDDEVDD